jgi:hypothetical protein
MSGAFFLLAIIVAMLVGVALGAYGASAYWQRELYHVRRNAERDLYHAQNNSSYWYGRASDAEWKLTTAYDLILALKVRPYRSHDLPADRTSAIRSFTPTQS